MQCADRLKTEMATPLPPPQKPPGDCDGCEECAKSFRTLEQQKNPGFCYQAVLRDQTALRLHERTMMSICNDWKAICELIKQHEDLIEERWQKKTRLERHEALKSVMHGRELRHKLPLWLGESNEQLRPPGELLLLNHFTMSRLAAGPRTFLGLLRARQSFHPC